MNDYNERQNPTSSGLDNGAHGERSICVEGTKCALRFPFFDRAWDDEGIDSYEDDALNHFPSLHEVRGMLTSEEYKKFPLSPGDRVFWDSMKSCSAPEIYFLDKYFSDRNLARLLDVILFMDSQIDRMETHVYIYTVSGNEMKSLEDEFVKHQEEYKRWEKLKLSIYCVKREVAAKMHDRFALLGKSLWHFGASAGAMHTDIHAYSGPWPDTYGKCGEFMRNLRDWHLAEKRLLTERN